MDPGERDAPPKQRANTAPGGVVKTAISSLEECTPQPYEVSSGEAWDHATKVQERTANALAEIAHAAGVGVDVNDRIDALEREVTSTSKKLKTWQAVAMAALSAAGISVYGVVTGVYDRGAREGANEVRLTHVEQSIDKLEIEIAGIRTEIEMIFMRDKTSPETSIRRLMP